jgi:hypothetical protein
VSSEIHSLDIQIHAADFTIVHGDQFSVESNLRKLTVEEKNGVLVIEEKTKASVRYTNAMLKLYVPADIVFEDVKISAGAGRLTAAALNADSMTLNLGAGQVRFDSITANSCIDIEGGAGEITIADGILNNLSLQMGVGRFSLTSVLLGRSELDFGVGETDLTLIGKPDDYWLDVSKGIGSIQIDGSHNGNKNAQNRVNIQGGIGAANVRFLNR